jgi:hypothetical protein
MARKVGDVVAEMFGNAFGVITAVEEEAPDVFLYTVEWDDHQYPDEKWTEQELQPVAEAA